MPILTAADAPRHELEGTRFTSLATPRRGSIDTAVWRVEIAPDTPAIPHTLTREEVLVVIRGRAAVAIGDDRSDALPGDVILVPRDTSFELRNGGSDLLELICCLPVGGEAVVAGATFTPPWAT